MTRIILATAAAVLFSAAANAREPRMELAMGPTSAAHLPTNPPRGNAPPDCTLAYDQCPEGRGVPKYPYKTPKHPRHQHHRNY